MRIGEDFGQSAGRTGQRSGCERLLGEIAIGKVGLILSLEVSRISRANSNWYHLLDICAVTHTLIGDAEGWPTSLQRPAVARTQGPMREAECFAKKFSDKQIARILHRTRSSPGSTKSTGSVEQSECLPGRSETLTVAT